MSEVGVVAKLKLKLCCSAYTAGSAGDRKNFSRNLYY